MSHSGVCIDDPVSPGNSGLRLGCSSTSLFDAVHDAKDPMYIDPNLVSHASDASVSNCTNHAHANDLSNHAASANAVAEELCYDDSLAILFRGLCDQVRVKKAACVCMCVYCV